MSTKTTRRQFIKKTTFSIVGVGSAIALGNVAFTKEIDLPDPYPDFYPQKLNIPPYNEKASFFDRHQYEIVATLAALIIPTTDTPGATEAGVVDTIDTEVANSERRQKAYRKGVKWIDEFSCKEFGPENTFLKLSIPNQIELLRKIDKSKSTRYRQAYNLWEKIEIKLSQIKDDIFGIGNGSHFFWWVRRDVIKAFYSSPLSWPEIGYFGPPQPNGYTNFSAPPSADNYTGTVRYVQTASCKSCHQDVKHPTGELIDHSCKRCHRPHSPWPYNKDAFHLEDHIGFAFPTPDRKKGER